MDTLENMPDYGSVVTYVYSDKRGLLVIDYTKYFPKLKLPGGKMEKGEDVITAAIREIELETGIQLRVEEVRMLCSEWYSYYKYHPFFCVAYVSEETLDTRSEIGDEDDHPIFTRIFDRSKILEIPNLLEPHRLLIRKVEGR